MMDALPPGGDTENNYYHGLPPGGATVESTQNAPREIVTSVSTTRGDGRVLDQLSNIRSQIDVVSGTCHRRK